MAVTYMDFTAKDVQYKTNVEKNVLAKKNDENYIYELGIEQLNSIGNMSLLDIYLNNENVLEAHYHQNASELVYCITGSARVAMLNPFTDEMIPVDLEPKDAASVPQGWWHYIYATMDDTHLLSTFDTPLLQTIFGSQILQKTPKEALAHMYCLDEEAVEKALDPIEDTVIIGPPSDCSKENEEKDESNHQSSKKNAKQTWRPHAPPFPGAFSPKR